MIKAIFLDIDGTLVSFATHEVPRSTIEALAAAKEKGIKVFVSTGRPKVIITNLGELDKRHIIDGYVSMNGAYCFVGDDVIYSKSLPQESVAAIARFVAQGEKPCIFVTEHHIYVNRPDDMVRQIFYDYLHVNTIPETTLEEAAARRTFQITPFITPEEEARLIPQLKGCNGDRWHPAFTDIITSECDKGRGVELIAAHEGLTRDEVMCIGDGGNDISMLRSASIGVAMGNAEESVKRQANYVTTSVDDDGVKNALVHFGLI